MNTPPVQNKNSNFNSGMNAASGGGQAIFLGGKSELQCSFCMRKGHAVDSCFKKLNSIAAVTYVGGIREGGVDSNQKFNPHFNKKGAHNNCIPQFRNKAKQSDFIQSDTERINSDISRRARRWYTGSRRSSFHCSTRVRRHCQGPGARRSRYCRSSPDTA